MIGDERIDEILDCYEMLRERGEETPVEELCDDPAICAEVLRRLAALRAFDTFLRDSTTEKSPPANDGRHEDGCLANGQGHGKNDAKSIDFDAGRYTPLRFHAEGGLGRIYLARDCELKRDVALKRINARQARDEHTRQRFELEAEITGRLEHPGIVPVYGFGVDRTGQPYYAMRYIRGQNLGDAIARYFQSDKVKYPAVGQRIDGAELRTLLRRFLTVCETIAYAHSRGIVHRDLKPANIMLGEYGAIVAVLALAVATGFLNDAWGKAEDRRKEADKQSKIAKKQAELADKQAALAKKQKKLADEARAEAERLAEAEKEQRQEVEQNLYRSLILLADREMENNNVARATELLDEASADLRDWE